ncbi:MAG: hypothetical protein JWO16_2090, partial [Sphingomonas bacterium]|nr:hypothetical protein [Sphingomonas bacterium]
AQHPKMAQRYEARLEARSAAAAEGNPPAAATLPYASAITPDQRAARREAVREWRIQRRAQRLANRGGRWREGTMSPVR